MKLTFADRGVTHLERVHSYITSDNSLEVANAQIGALLDLIEQRLLPFPGLGHVARRKGTRELSQAPYLIVYRTKAESLTVLAVFDGRRNRGVSYAP